LDPFTLEDAGTIFRTMLGATNPAMMQQVPDNFRTREKLRVTQCWHIMHTDLYHSWALPTTTLLRTVEAAVQTQYMI